MTRHFGILAFLVTIQCAFAQTFNLDNRIKITIPKHPDWTVSTHYCDTAKSICQFIQMNKNIDTKTGRFSDITLKYETTDQKIYSDQDKNGCLFGSYTKIDTVTLSGYKAKRWFGTECNVSKEDYRDDKITIYSIDVIVNINQNK